MKIQLRSWVAAGIFAVLCCGAQRQPNSVTLPDGSVFTGTISNGLFEGKGILVYGDGDYYEGEFRQGRLEGKGILQYANGGSYSGGFKRGQSSGTGIELLRNGDKYDGEFNSGSKNGTGIYTAASGEIYRGQFRDGMYHGTGIIFYATGGSYEGEFKAGLADGHGILRYRDGGQYKGQFKNGQFDGRGLLNYPNGDSYEGAFKDGVIVDHSGYFSEFPRGLLLLGFIISLLFNVIMGWCLRSRQSSSESAAASLEKRGAGGNRHVKTCEAAALTNRAACNESMRMVFTAPGIVVCDMLRGMLESDGIQCFLRNEPSSTIGLGDPIPQCPSLSYAWPEVWVSAEDFERAMIIAANFNHAEQAPSAEKE